MTPRPPGPPPSPLLVALGTAAAYALVGWVALMLAGPPGYASPLYPSTGIALAATLVYGRAALPGVLIGAFVANAGLGALRGQSGWELLPLPLLIGCGAALQAAGGAWLLRRFVQLPLVLNAPRDIFLTGLYAAAIACMISPSVATPALWWSGVIHAGNAASTWLTWWLGDTMGVLIGLPLALTLIGQPQEDWRPRRRTLGVPMLIALALLGAGMLELGRAERQRLQATFDRDANRLAGDAQERLGAPLHALQALHGAARWTGGLGPEELRAASRWWLAQPLHLQAMGYSVRVAPTEVPALEAQARAEGLADFRVFDRADGPAIQAEEDRLVLRHIEPLASNAAALGVNVLSIPAAREAIQASRDSGEPAASAGFRLTQSTADETGVVLYQALFDGEPAWPAARRLAWRGMVFVTVNTEQALAGLAAPSQDYLQWCVIDPAPGVPRPRLAGVAGCEASAPPRHHLAQDLPLNLGGRPLRLRISAPSTSVPGRQRETSLLLSTVGLTATAMLGALLLTVTGQSRRTELAVLAGTAELRREMAERAHAEQALRDSEARLRSILDHVPLGVIFLEPDGRIIDCNPRACEMLGRSAEVLRASAVAELLDGQEFKHVRQQRSELLAGAEIVAVGPLHLVTPDGQARQLRVSASALRDTMGRVLRMVCVLEDVTEHLRLEASERALQRAEAANRAKSEFLSRMSHELRTPLNAMIGFTQLLELDRKPTLAAHQHGWTQQILRAGWHLLEMINETLDLARIESGAVKLSLVPVDLVAMVAACRAMVEPGAVQRRLRLQEDLAAEASAVLADSTRLKQVLTNLLSNAVKYNRTDGSILVRSRLGPDARVRIEVIDTGLGMDAEQLAHLFEPYNRLGRESSGIEGTGIGLVISRRLSELMDGTLEVHSEAGRGSTFTLSLPAAALAQMPPPTFSPSLPAPYSERRVHYVEDNETNVELMRGVLAQRGQIVLETSALGLDGLAAVRRRRPDLILLDMQLPDISGLELLRHLKQDPDMAAVPVIVVSADATPAHMQQALTLGALHYVTKPLDMGRFLELVDGILESAESRWAL